MNDDPQLTGFTGRALILETFMLTGTGPVESVLICDDRADVHDGLASMLTLLPGSPAISSVSHGFALVQSFAANPPDVVLVGIHRGSTSGAEAITMLMKSQPDAMVIVFGVAADIEQLAAVFVRGARGLLLWDPDDYR